jgi:hypothetical protein
MKKGLLSCAIIIKKEKRKKKKEKQYCNGSSCNVINVELFIGFSISKNLATCLSKVRL